MGFAPSLYRAQNDGIPPEILGPEFSREHDVNVANDLYPNGKRCFICGEILGDAVEDHTVYWHGYISHQSGDLLDDLSVNIFLHPTCAITFGAHLSKDGLIAQKPSQLRVSTGWLWEE